MSKFQLIGGITVAGAICLGSHSRVQAASMSCTVKPISALPSTMVTNGSVASRSGSVITYQAAAGLIRVGGSEAVERGLGAGDMPTSTDHGAVVPGPSAAMSYVAYFAEGRSAAERPIMFVWDGGPGSSTRPMLLASFGPVLEAEPGPGGGAAAATSAPIRPDPDTLLDVTDLVFVDAPGTGFGHLEGCAPEASFYGIDEDSAAFQRFIHRFLSTHHRERSPLFLFGESYGTLRATVVARGLEEAGTSVSGIVLLSQDLAWDAESDGALGNPGTENAFFLSLPSFAATAWFHGRVAHAGDLDSWLRAVEQFSLNEYAPALLQGSDLPLQRRRALAARLAAYTSLPEQTWLDADLRIEASRFSKLLEADEGKIVGREDSRLEGPAPKAGGTPVEDDPTLTVRRAARLAAFRAYVQGTLGLGDRPFTPDVDVHWDLRHRNNSNGWDPAYVNAGPDLVAAMKINPRMNVFVAGGYFDLATPYFAMPYLIKHLDLTEPLRANLSWRLYPAGHSAYYVDEVRHDMHERISALITKARGARSTPKHVDR